MRPRTLCQVFDHLAHPLLTFDKDYIAFFHVTFELLEVIRAPRGVVLQPLRQEFRALPNEKAASGQPGRRDAHDPYCKRGKAEETSRERGYSQFGLSAAGV